MPTDYERESRKLADRMLVEWGIYVRMGNHTPELKCKSPSFVPRVGGGPVEWVSGDLADMTEADCLAIWGLYVQQSARVQRVVSDTYLRRAEITDRIRAIKRLNIAATTYPELVNSWQVSIASKSAAVLNLLDKTQINRPQINARLSDLASERKANTVGMMINSVSMFLDTLEGLRAELEPIKKESPEIYTAYREANSVFLSVASSIPSRIAQSDENNRDIKVNDVDLAQYAGISERHRRRILDKWRLDVAREVR